MSWQNGYLHRLPFWILPKELFYCQETVDWSVLQPSYTGFSHPAYWEYLTPSEVSRRTRSLHITYFFLRILVTIENTGDRGGRGWSKSDPNQSSRDDCLTRVDSYNRKSFGFLCCGHTYLCTPADPVGIDLCISSVVCTKVFIYVYMYICVYVYICICIYVYLFISIYRCICYIRMCVCLYTYICVYM